MNTAVAITETDLLALGRSDFDALCLKHPEIERGFSLLQGSSLRLVLNLLVDASLLNLPGRLVRTIQRLLISEGKQDADGLNYITCSHDLLARYVAASRPSTSIELKKLEATGMIRSAYGKLYVLDRQALNDCSDRLTSFDAVAAIYAENEDPGSPAV
jgi:CRP/FNR family cyclic AMP-dependent transcriptional regulator